MRPVTSNGLQLPPHSLKGTLGTFSNVSEPTASDARLERSVPTWASAQDRGSTPVIGEPVSTSTARAFAPSTDPSTVRTLKT